MQQQKQAAQDREVAGQSQHASVQHQSPKEPQVTTHASCSLNRTDLKPLGAISAAAAAAAFEQQQQLLGEDELIQGIHAYQYYGTGCSDEETDSLAGLNVSSVDAELSGCDLGEADNCSSSMALQQQQEQVEDQNVCQKHPIQQRNAISSDKDLRNPPPSQQPSSAEQVQYACSSASTDGADPLLQLLKQYQQQRQHGIFHNDDALLDMLPPLQRQQQQQPVGQAEVPVPAAAVQATQELLAGLSLHVQSQQAEACQCQHRQQQQQHRQQQQHTVEKSGTKGVMLEADETLDARALLQLFSSDTDDDPRLELQQDEQQQQQQQQQEEEGQTHMQVPTAAVQAMQLLLADLSLQGQPQGTTAQHEQQHQHHLHGTAARSCRVVDALVPDHAPMDGEELSQLSGETDEGQLLLLLQDHHQQHGRDEIDDELQRLLLPLMQREHQRQQEEEV